MNAIKSKPYIFSFLFVLLFFILLGLISLPAQRYFEQALNHFDYRGYLTVTVLGQFALAIIIIGIMRKLNLNSKCDFTRPTFKGLLLGWYGLLLGLVMLGTNIWGTRDYLHWPTILMLLLTILTALTTGLFEEVLVRGLALNLLLEKTGIKKAVILSSLFFGLGHYFNMVTGETFLSVSVQVIYATMFGIFAAALYIRTKTLWVPIIVHAVFDLGSFLLFAVVSRDGFVELSQEAGEATSGLVAQLPTLLIMSPLMIIGLYLLRNKQIASLGLGHNNAVTLGDFELEP